MSPARHLNVEPIGAIRAIAVVDTVFRKIEVLEYGDGATVIRETIFYSAQASVSRIDLRPHEAEALVMALQSLEGPAGPRTVNFSFVEEDGPDGKRSGGECSVCHERFFDRMAKGKRRRVLESGIQKAINHAKEAHGSTGGKFGS